MRLHQHLRREQGRHTDDWLITYADTITLLLCLFVIILSIRTGGKAVPRDAAAPVHQATVVEDIFAGNPPFPALPRITESEALEAPPENSVGIAEPTALTPRRITIGGDDLPPESIGTMPAPRPDPPSWARMAGFEAVSPIPVARPAQIAALPEPSLPAVVGRLKSLGTDVVEQRGDRITTLQISSAAFFSSGYATLSSSGKSILRDVAVTLKSGEFAAYRISVEGHTDDSPISTAQFQSNWELSTARAASVVRFFLEEGIPPRKLTAAGYAGTFPVAPNRTADGTVIPENQAKNRRVVIRLEKIDKAE